MSGKKGMNRPALRTEADFKAGTTRRRAYVARICEVIEALSDGAVHKDEDIWRVAIIHQMHLVNSPSTIQSFIRAAALTPWVRIERGGGRGLVLIR